MSRALKWLGIKSFVRRKQQLLTEQSKGKQLKRCKTWMKSQKNALIVKIFSDKKIFTVNQFHNRRNDHWLALDQDDVEGICTSKQPQQVMVLGIITSEGKRMLPIFFNKNEKCTAGVYYKLLRYKVLPWIKQNYPNGDYVWQQDGAPAHTARKNQKFCKRHFEDFWDKSMWPPSSPDLNPLDYFWWSILESRVNATPHPNLDSLKAKISEEWMVYPEATTISACKTFCTRVETVIAAEGSWIEH